MASGAAADGQETTTEKKQGIHIEINGRTILMAAGVILAVIVLGLVIHWLVTHSYLIRQKVAGIRSRRMERRRYRTIRDTRKSRRRRKKERRSKHLRF